MTTRSHAPRHVLTWSIAVLAAVAALAGATVGYQLMSGAGTSSAAAAQQPGGDATSPHRAAARPVVVKYRPCPRGFERRQASCVRTVQRTHVVHVAAPTPTAVAPSATTVSASRSLGAVRDAGDDHGGRNPGARDDDRGHDRGDDRGHDRGHDRGDDHGDHHGEDDGPEDD